MEMNSIDSSQALTAYINQQQGTARADERERDTTQAARAATRPQGDQVSFSSEAVRLSSQDAQGTRNDAVNRSSGGEAAKRQQEQAANPEAARAAAAQTPAQAINQYRSTSIL